MEICQNPAGRNSTIRGGRPFERFVLAFWTLAGLPAMSRPRPGQRLDEVGRQIKPNGVQDRARRFRKPSLPLRDCSSSCPCSASHAEPGHLVRDHHFDLAELSDLRLASTVHSRRPGPNRTAIPRASARTARRENVGVPPPYSWFGECRHRAAKSFRAREQRVDIGGQGCAAIVEAKMNGKSHLRKGGTTREMDLRERGVSRLRDFRKASRQGSWDFMWRRAKDGHDTAMILLEL